MAEVTRRPLLNRQLSRFGTTVFAEMSALAAETGAVNLGQGFPDYDAPAAVLDAARRAIAAGHNQYPPGAGIAELRAAIAEHQLHCYDLAFDPEREILVTTGATEAIAAAVLGLCEPGDEVVTFEPFYDSYAATIALAGARQRTVRLRAPDWSFEPRELASAVSAQTRLVLLNSPHNPTGRVFSREELSFIAELCVERDLLVVTDEVYEHLVFDGEHLPLASFPGMGERTVTISSAGKTFSVTGWKIGWCCGPAELITAVRTVKQFLTYATGTPFQYAVAHGLGLPDADFDDAATRLRDRRDQLRAGLTAAGLVPFSSAATYFVIVDVRSVGYESGTEFCRDLIERHGVAAIPIEGFYTDPAAGRPFVRFAFCKRSEVLAEAIARLEGLERH